MLYEKFLNFYEIGETIAQFVTLLNRFYHLFSKNLAFELERLPVSSNIYLVAHLRDIFM